MNLHCCRSSVLVCVCILDRRVLPQENRPPPVCPVSFLPCKLPPWDGKRGKDLSTSSAFPFSRSSMYVEQSSLRRVGKGLLLVGPICHSDNKFTKLLPCQRNPSHGCSLPRDRDNNAITCPTFVNPLPALLGFEGRRRAVACEQGSSIMTETSILSSANTINNNIAVSQSPCQKFLRRRLMTRILAALERTPRSLDGGIRGDVVSVLRPACLTQNITIDFQTCGQT